MVLLIIIPIKWLFHWEYALFSDKPKSWLTPTTIGIARAFSLQRLLFLLGSWPISVCCWATMLRTTLYFFSKSGDISVAPVSFMVSRPQANWSYSHVFSWRFQLSGQYWSLGFNTESMHRTKYETYLRIWNEVQKKTGRRSGKELLKRIGIRYLGIWPGDFWSRDLRALSQHTLI